MKKTININAALMALFAIMAISLFACNKGEDKDKRPSPPSRVTGKAGKVSLCVDYSSPKIKGRTVWGELVPYGKVWRTGANEATFVEFDEDVLVEGNEVKAGKYSLFTIPEQGEWTVILNKTWEQWGAYEYKPEQDALRFKVTPQTGLDMSEDLVFEINPSGDAAEISVKWEKLKLAFKVEDKK